MRGGADLRLLWRGPRGLLRSVRGPRRPGRPVLQPVRDRGCLRRSNIVCRGKGKRPVKCTHCQTENDRGAAFCVNCGKALKARRRGGATRRNAPYGHLKTVAVVLGVVAIGLAVYAGRPGTSMRQGETSPAPRAYASDVLDVASRFYCGCGSCDVPELADCVCPTAIQEKDLIEAELRKGRPTGDILRLVDGRFGHLKPQYASLVGGPVSRPATSAQGAPDRPSGNADPTDEGPEGSASRPARLATASDAERIASRFICACGECQDHVLSRCTCDHPRGAKEMKAFISYRISQKQHSVAQVVDAVAYEYGHLRQNE